MHQDQPLLLLLLLLLHRSFSIAIENNNCTTSCGEVTNIKSPFRLMGDPKFCGHSDFELACIDNRTILDLNSSKYFVHNIDYTNQTIRIADVKLQKGDCSSLPLQSFCGLNRWHNYYYCYSHYYASTVSIVSCVKAVDFPFYIDASSCLDGPPLLNFSGARRRVYALVNASVPSMETACTIEFMVMLSPWVDESNLRSYAEIHKRMVYGFEIYWFHPQHSKIGENIQWFVSSTSSADAARAYHPDIDTRPVRDPPENGEAGSLGWLGSARWQKKGQTAQWVNKCVTLPLK